MQNPHNLLGLYWLQRKIMSLFRKLIYIFRDGIAPTVCVYMVHQSHLFDFQTSFYPAGVFPVTFSKSSSPSKCSLSQILSAKMPCCPQWPLLTTPRTSKIWWNLSLNTNSTKIFNKNRENLQQMVLDLKWLPSREILSVILMVLTVILVIPDTICQKYTISWV